MRITLLPVLLWSLSLTACSAQSSCTCTLAVAPAAIKAAQPGSLRF